jgi:flagellar protein FliL
MNAGKKQSEDEETEASGGGKKKLIIIIILVLLLAGGAAGAYFGGFLDSLIGAEKSEEKDKKSDKSTNEAGEDEASAKDGEKSEDETKDVITYHDLPEFVANLNPGSNTPSFIKMAVTLEAENVAIITRIQEKQPKIQDVINTYLRELRPSDLKGSAGVHRLREELTLRVNKILYPDKINNILFKELLIQ